MLQQKYCKLKTGKHKRADVQLWKYIQLKMNNSNLSKIQLDFRVAIQEVSKLTL